MPLLELPRTTAIGDIIAYANERIKTPDGLKKRYTFAGAEYFERMKSLGLYSTDKDLIKTRIQRMGLIDIYREKLI
jgi:hypothetical protein